MAAPLPPALQQLYAKAEVIEREIIRLERLQRANPAGNDPLIKERIGRLRQKRTELLQTGMGKEMAINMKIDDDNIRANTDDINVNRNQINHNTARSTSNERSIRTLKDEVAACHVLQASVERVQSTMKLNVDTQIESIKGRMDGFDEMKTELDGEISNLDGITNTNQVDIASNKGKVEELEKKVDDNWVQQQEDKVELEAKMTTAEERRDARENDLIHRHDRTSIELGILFQKLKITEM